jgi:hypothetical protein
VLSLTDAQMVNDIALQKIEVDDYIELFSPALEWLLQNIGHFAAEDVFFAVLRQYVEYCNNSAVLFHLIGAFDPALVSKHAMSITTLIRDGEVSHAILSSLFLGFNFLISVRQPCKAFQKSRLYLSLGRALIASPPPKNQRLPILNDVWKVVSKVQDPIEYCEIAEVFVEYILKHFSVRLLLPYRYLMLDSDFRSIG